MLKVFTASQTQEEAVNTFRSPDITTVMPGGLKRPGKFISQRWAAIDSRNYYWLEGKCKAKG